MTPSPQPERKQIAEQITIFDSRTEQLEKVFQELLAQLSPVICPRLKDQEPMPKVIYSDDVNATPGLLCPLAKTLLAISDRISNHIRDLHLLIETIQL